MLKLRNNEYQRRSGMSHIKTKRLFQLFFLMVGIMFYVVPCASVEKPGGYCIRGGIMKITGSDVYVCVGSADGVTVGQEFSVYTVRVVEPPPPSVPEPFPEHQYFKREYKGKIKITKIFGGHFAEAQVISGTPEVHDIVESMLP
jgi:hypothetical protein